MKPWTKEETTLLIEYSKQMTPLNQRLADFPDRTLVSLYKRLSRVNATKKRAVGRLPYRETDVIRVLTEQGPMFAKDVAELLGVKYGGISELLGEMKRQKKVHIGERIRVSGRNYTFLWVAGPGVDAPPMGWSKRVRIVKEKPAKEKPQTKITVRRDPLVEAFFGQVSA